MLKFGVTQTQGACFEAASKSLHDLMGRMCLMLWLTLVSSAKEQWERQIRNQVNARKHMFSCLVRLVLENSAICSTLITSIRSL